MHARSSVSVCVRFDLVDYLGQRKALCEVDRPSDDEASSFLESRHRRRRRYRHLPMHEHEWLRQHPPKKRVNIVISDMDTTSTCDRPLVKLLKSYCCEWNCQSVIFKKFQVSTHRRD